MSYNMLIQVTLVSTAIGTVRTAERFFSSVGSHVSLQITSHSEALVAQVARVGLLPCMGADMNLQVAFQGSSEVTVRASVGLFHIMVVHFVARTSGILVGGGGLPSVNRVRLVLTVGPHVRVQESYHCRSSSPWHYVIVAFHPHLQKMPVLFTDIIFHNEDVMATSSFTVALC